MVEEENSLTLGAEDEQAESRHVVTGTNILSIMSNLRCYMEEGRAPGSATRGQELLLGLSVPRVGT